MNLLTSVAINTVFGRKSLSNSLMVTNTIIVAIFGAFLMASFSVQSQTDKADKPSHADVAEGFARAVNLQEVNAIANFIDFKGFGAAVVAQLEIEKNLKQAIMNQYQTSDFARTFTNSSFILPPEALGTYGYIGMITTTQYGKRPLIRVDYKGGGHEFILLFINEFNKIEDLFYASKGNKVSAAVAGTTQLILPTQNGFITRLLGNTGNNQEVLRKFNKMLALRQQGKFVEVHNILQTLPEKMLSTRELIDFNVLISQSVDDEAYVNALTKLNTYFGDDESTSFMLIDFHVTMDDFPAAIRSVDKAMAFWGRDAALVHLKANLVLLTEDNAQAIALAKEAIEIEPSFEDPYWTLLSLQDAKKDAQGVNSTLAAITKQFDDTFTPSKLNELFNLPNYEASDVYKAALDRKRF